MIHRPSGRVAPLALAVLLMACGGSQPGPPPTEVDPELPPDQFSSRRALGELQMLMAFQADGVSDESREAARSRIRGALEEARIGVDSVETRLDRPDAAPLELEHLVATLPGRSADRVVLVASLDALDTGSDLPGDDLSGAALLVELARVFAHRDFPYTLEFVWIEGEGPEEGDGGPSWLGSRSLAQTWAEAGRLDDVRLLLAVNRVCDVDLDIARDLGSHRNHRETFFRMARSLGRGAAFPTGRPFASVVSSHRAFRRAGLRSVVVIEDQGRGEGVADGEAAPSATCSADSLETVGLVLLEGVELIGARLAKIDRFARVPQVEKPLPDLTPPPSGAEPEAAATSEPEAALPEAPEAGAQPAPTEGAPTGPEASPAP